MRMKPGLDEALDKFNMGRHDEPDGDESGQGEYDSDEGGMSDHGDLMGVHTHPDKEGGHHLIAHYNHPEHGHHTVVSHHKSHEELGKAVAMHHAKK